MGIRMQQVPKDQVLKRLALENPWWEPPYQVSTYSDLTPRPYLNLLYPLLVERSVRRAVVLLGPRRVGKTVLLHHALKRLIESGEKPRRICYVSVDNPVYVNLSLEDFLNLYQEHTGISFVDEKTFFFFDEIQYLRQWEVHLKTVVDSFPNIKCVASGSAAAALRLRSDESGAGRFTDFLLPPLTFHEYLQLTDRTQRVTLDNQNRISTPDISALNDLFVEYLNFGGYPEVAFSKTIQADPARFIKSDIIDKVLLRDLPSLYGIQDIQELNALFTSLAYNTAQEVSLEQLSQYSGVAKPTIKRYIEYLEAAFLIRTVKRVGRDARSFQRDRTFKVYLTNPSMRTALFSKVGADDHAIGAMVETAIFAQWFHSERVLQYARWKKGEIDIVNLRDSRKWAVEVKWSDAYVDDIDKLKETTRFCNRHGIPAVLVTSKTRTKNINVGNLSVEFMPAALYCYQLGYNIVKGLKSRAAFAIAPVPPSEPPPSAPSSSSSPP